MWKIHTCLGPAVASDPRKKAGKYVYTPPYLNRDTDILTRVFLSGDFGAHVMETLQWPLCWWPSDTII